MNWFHTQTPASKHSFSNTKTNCEKLREIMNIFHTHYKWHNSWKIALKWTSCVSTTVFFCVVAFLLLKLKAQFIDGVDIMLQQTLSMLLLYLIIWAYVDIFEVFKQIYFYSTIFLLYAHIHATTFTHLTPILFNTDNFTTWVNP